MSVVLPTYNRADLLGRSIGSVLEQTYEDYELIVVDDASTDDTAETIKQLNDDRIQYIRHAVNSGAAAARNTGIKAAEGDIIAFQDSDDRWEERKLEKQIDAFENSAENVGVVYTGTRKESPDSEEYIPGRGVQPKEGNIEDSILRYNFVTPQAAAVKKRCFETVGTFDEELPPLSDWEMWIRMSEFYEFKFVDEQLVTAYLQEDSISTNNDANVLARERIIEKHRDRFNGETLARQLFFIGHGAIKTGDMVKGRRYLREAFEADSQLQYLGALGLSFFGPRLYQAAYNQYKGTHV
ncbi:glycosyltransferase family 2 protein [Halovenus amylolytica]|uniref:glycosyltransferase family 2 protein n=1 Tax=Halovenus amylolytica TaxID=2500550 RepID=UPI003D6B3664